MRPGRSSFRSLPPAARLFIVAIGAAGFAVLAQRILRPDTAALRSEDALIGWMLLGLAIGLGPMTVKLGRKVEMSAAMPFIFAALLVRGLPAALDVAGLSVLSSCLLRRNPFEFHRTVFNVSSILASTWVAGQVFMLIRGGERSLLDPVSVIALAAAVGAYFLVNSSSVATVIGLSRDSSITMVWRESFLWTFVSYYAGASIACGMAGLMHSKAGALLMLLSLPPVLLVQRSYRLYQERMEERRKRLEAVEDLNAQLERMVEQRTRELREANEQLQVSNEELKRANRLKSEFLANMSHELRTPLNAIIGFSELLDEGSYGPLSETQRDFVRDIHESGRHLLSLINGVLDLSKIEAGRMTLNREEFTLSGLVRDCASVVRPLALKKNLEIEAQLDDAPQIAWADGGMLKQVLYNLLSNAVKFTQEGGRVRVRGWQDGGDLMIAVADTGIGIPPADLDRIFQEFYQVDGSYSRKYQGTGLGLALVRRFVEMHGGTIAVLSEPGKGSTFTFRIPDGVRGADTDPLGSAPGHPQAGAGDLPAGPQGCGRILLVEDNPTNMKLARNLLVRGGFEVVEALSGEEALACLRGEVPDLILMDVQLPGMDGLELTRRIHSDLRSAGIPIVALTAHVMAGDRERALASGCVGYIPKPIDPHRFSEQVMGFLAMTAA